MDLKATRKRLRLSQSELAAKLGLHQTAISRFETGARPLDERTRLAVQAIALQVAA